MKTLLTTIITIFSLSTMAQTTDIDTLNIIAQTTDIETNVYQYKFTIKDITSRGSSELVKEPLYDLFKTIPIYVETINTFVFESKEDILQYECAKLIPNWEITYFRKYQIKNIEKLN